jgi:CxxC motif-containing protein (DUF1111 family)
MRNTFVHRRPALACPLPSRSSLSADHPAPGRLLWTALLCGSLAACGGGGGGNDSAATATASGGTDGSATILAVQGASGAGLAGPQQGETELFPVKATSSAIERGDLGPEKAIDKNPGTRWGSAFSDNQDLTLDFGTGVAVSRLLIQWENAHATRYEVQSSADGSAWTTVRTVDGSAGGTESVPGLSGTARFWRIKGLKRSTAYGYSIFEVRAFSGTSTVPVPDPVPDPTPQPQPQPQPEPPPGPTPPPIVDLDQPGVAIRPVAVTSSTPENQGLAAPFAADGNAGTRWSSRSEDGAWIQFDFGAKTKIGALKLVWENSYGKAYVLQVSDDGSTWSQLRYVTDGKGGTEAFYNLGVNARYVRLQGIARGTQYGYSLFEVEFKTPGSDNTMATLQTSPLKFPAGGGALSPLPGTRDPLEAIQFTLADGTLVTRFGMVGRSRHARERGEDWNEIGYGPNETVDAAGNPVDKGPGAHLNFVANYFRNRTWGVEFLDNSRVPGVTRPRIVINQYYQQAQRGGGHSLVRRFDTTGVTGYGWMSPGELLDNSTYTAGFQGITACPVVPKPPQNALRRPADGYKGIVGANDGCSVVFDTFPGHTALAPDANGVLVPNGVSVPARALKVGDAIEFTGSFFASRAAMDAVGDSGAFRYYTNEVTYVMGTGLRPWYGVQPRLMNAPLPDDTLSGGIGSVSYDYADNGKHIFQQPHNHIGMQNMQRFVEGRRLIHTNFFTGDHSEPGNDRYQAAAGLQGPRFNQSACVACHVNNGRSPAPSALNQRLDAMSVHTATLDADGRQLPHPRYGMTVQMNARSAAGALQDWGNGVRVGGFDTQVVKLADGSSVELRKPKLAFDGPVPAVYSLRSAQPMLGTGLLEAIPEADILARARTTPDADGVKGQANFVFDPETGETRLGRFGWKAAKASLRHQTASALLADMSVTSPVYGSRECLAGPARCKTATPERGISEADLQSVTRYLALLAVPAQRSLASGFPKGVSPLPDLDVAPEKVVLGRKVFADSKCVACHTPEMKTGNTHPFAELRNQTIRPYTDLLLHDMGPGLADGFSEGAANGRQWRTPALWGIGYTARVQGGEKNVGYLHDGRARNLTEAILWHGGEAERSRQTFEALTAKDRDALLAFLRSL